MRRATAVAAVLVALSFSGCALDPFGNETQPTLSDFGVRVSAGIGAADPYLPGVSVEPDSTVQFRARIGDGNVVEFAMPRGPAEEIEVSAFAEGSDESIETVTVSSIDGTRSSSTGSTAVDPGFVGVEDHSTADELRLRIAAPRLTGTAQGQVTLTFKTDVIRPGSAR